MRSTAPVNEQRGWGEKENHNTNLVTDRLTDRTINEEHGARRRYALRYGAHTGMAQVGQRGERFLCDVGIGLTTHLHDKFHALTHTQQRVTSICGATRHADFDLSAQT